MEALAEIISDFFNSIGQTLPSRDFCGTAASPLKPDIGWRGWHVRKVPQADSCTAAKSNPLTSRSAQRPERRLGDSEHDEARDRRRRDEIVGWCQIAAGHTDQPSRDEGREPAEHRHRDVVSD